MPGHHVLDLDAAAADPPLDQAALEDLRWYLEDYLAAPFAVYEERGDRIREQLPGWGRALYRAAFGTCSSPASGDEHVVLLSSTPELLALPWELMAAPGHPQPVALEAAGMGRGLATTDEPREISVPGGRLRLLMVISRPSGTDDVGYRLVARAVQRGIEDIGAAVDVVVLRPPTLEALRAELASAREAGLPYQVVHFDGHGIVLAGQGSLVFERPGGGGHHVPASEVALVLGAARVPVVVLNACQSGAIGKRLEAAVATAMLEGGVDSVVAMAYAVSSTAAAQFMARFYERLFDGGTVSAAVTAGRRRLFGHPHRPSPRGDLPLADWLIPVHYLRREVSFPREDATTAGATSAGSGTWAPSDGPGDGLDPVDGVFVGRDTLFYGIENGFLDGKPLVLTGIGGTGKTELAKAFARWWRDTGGTDRRDWVFWHSFEPGRASFGLEAVVDEIGLRRFGVRFAAQSAGQRERQVLEFLTSSRALLVWDNFESVHTLAAEGRAAPPLSIEECAELNVFLRQVAAGGMSRVLITSRSQEEWLDFAGRLRVEGLAAHEAAEYANHLVAGSAEAQARRGRRAFGELMQRLDGHPLGMRLILPRLADTEPAVLLAELGRSLPPASAVPSAVPSDERTDSLAACIRYSYAHLGQAAQRLLPLLVLCHGTFDVVAVLMASDDSEMPSQFAAVPAADWVSAVEDAVRVGLVTRDWEGTGADMFGLYELHPALPGYLSDGWDPHASGGGADDGIRGAALRALVRAHASKCRVVNSEYETSGDPRILTRLERQQRTIGGLLEFALRHEMWDEAFGMFAAMEDVWDARGLVAEYLAWTERVCTAAERSVDHTSASAPAPETPAGDMWWHAARRMARWQAARGQVDQAERSYLRIVSGWEALKPSPVLLRRLDLIYDALAELCESRGETAQARAWRARVLAPATAPPAAEGVAMLRQSADAAENAGDLEAAEEFFHQALEANLAAGDRSGANQDMFRLGALAMRATRYQAAGDWFGKALAQARERGDEHDMALAYGGLGATAGLNDELDLAEQYFRRALGIAQSLGSPPMLMEPNLQSVAVAAWRRGRLDEALGWFRWLLALRESSGNRRAVADACESLGAVAQEGGQWTDALDWRMRAFAIRRDQGDRAGAARNQAAVGALLTEADPPLPARVRAEVVAEVLGPGYLRLPGPAEAASPGGQNAAVPRVGPVWAALWHSPALRGAEFLDPGAEHRGQADLAVDVAAADPARARDLVRTGARQGWNTEALVGLAISWAGQDLARAEEAARSLPEGYARIRALAGVSGVLAAAGADPRSAARLAAEAEQAARGLEDGYPRSEALTAVAAALAWHDPERAERLVDDVAAVSEGRALALIAAVVAPTDAVRALRLMGRAEAVAHTIEHDGWRAESLAGIAAALSGIDPDRAAAVAASIALEEGFGHPKAEGLAVVVAALAPSDPERAAALAASIAHDYLRVRALASVAATLVATDPDKAVHLAGSIAHEGWRTEILSRVATVRESAG